MTMDKSRLGEDEQERYISPLTFSSSLTQYSYSHIEYIVHKPVNLFL